MIKNREKTCRSRSKTDMEKSMDSTAVTDQSFTDDTLR